MTEDSWDELLTTALGHDMDLIATTSPREAVERELTAGGPPRAAASLALWRRATAGVTTEEAMRAVAHDLGAGTWDPPDGNSWLTWMAWYGERLREAAEDPATILSPGAVPEWPYPWRVRDSAAVSGDSLRHAVHVLTGRHREEVRDWLADPDAGSRLHLVGDVGAVVGQAVRRAPLLERGVVASGVVTTRAAVVLRRLDAGGGGPAWEVASVHAAEPWEHPMAVTWRRELPALTSFLGGWFNASDLAGEPGRDEWRALRTEPVAFLDRVAAEVPRLLARSDLDLPAAVEALGCYAEPPHLRRWLGWLAWRIQRFDWS
ncbi:hypothetical protein MO973_40095 [Paenibacillus sp. TRM 82003]|uniref:hypothetical protein n=1 Tax=Kineococcus sp. TRM81007 TaxID=2925831 RepID=UPI001F58E099|nr:hypothetical protein [Kineococcus sp. TRM81007]MCI2237126.1 hypothetical protein [Kineococcus sp. TRM81007]MCI3926403.1 hypothetical protein [Paenibacillus sp. TRM 82003]